MTNEEIAHLGNVTAKAALRALNNAEGGLDRNHGQFISMVMGALLSIPDQMRGEETVFFIKKYQDFH